MDSVSNRDAHKSVRKEFLSSMDGYLYKVAAQGKLDVLINSGEPLNQLLTPNKNTILEVYLSAAGQAKSVKHYGFVGKVLDSRAEGHGCADLEDGAAFGNALLRITNVMQDTALHEAVRNNNFSVVNLLTKEDPHFMYLPNKAVGTPLYIAAERGYNDISSHLLESCTSLLFQGPNGRTALHAATISGNAELTRKLLELNDCVSKDVDQQGWTPMHHVAHFGHLSVVKQLLESDSSAMYIQDKDERKTQLHIAADHGDHRHFALSKSITRNNCDQNDIVAKPYLKSLSNCQESRGSTAVNSTPSSILRSSSMSCFGTLFPSQLPAAESSKSLSSRRKDLSKDLTICHRALHQEALAPIKLSAHSGHQLLLEICCNVLTKLIFVLILRYQSLGYMVITHHLPL
ncbi:Ankyrin repeat-containing protein At5g02620 [Linum perenne]